MAAPGAAGCPEPSTGCNDQPHEGGFFFYKLDSYSNRKVRFLSLNPLRNKGRAFCFAEQLML